MEDLLVVIKAWPIIVQGALGSALFSLIVFVGQRLARWAASRWSHTSKQARKTWLINEQAKCLATMAPTHEGFSTFATILLYRASRHLFKALMWVVLGLLAGLFLSWLGVIGYLGGLYYLFKTYEVVSPMDVNVHNQARLEELRAELQRLEA